MDLSHISSEEINQFFLRGSGCMYNTITDFISENISEILSVSECMDLAIGVIHDYGFPGELLYQPFLDSVAVKSNPIIGLDQLLLNRFNHLLSSGWNPESLMFNRYLDFLNKYKLEVEEPLVVKTRLQEWHYLYGDKKIKSVDTLLNELSIRKDLDSVVDLQIWSVRALVTLIQSIEGLGVKQSQLVEELELDLIKSKRKVNKKQKSYDKKPPIRS